MKILSTRIMERDNCIFMRTQQLDILQIDQLYFKKLRVIFAIPMQADKVANAG